MKSGNLKFLETCGPLRACNGTALPFTEFQKYHSFRISPWITPVTLQDITTTASHFSRYTNLNSLIDTLFNCSTSKMCILQSAQSIQYHQHIKRFKARVHDITPTCHCNDVIRRLHPRTLLNSAHLRMSSSRTSIHHIPTVQCWGVSLAPLATFTSVTNLWHFQIISRH